MRIRYALSEEESRFRLNAMRIELTEHGARAIATDGHRMGLQDVRVANWKNGPAAEFLLAKRAARAIEHILHTSLDGERVAVSVDNRSYFRFGNTCVIATHGNGNFPDYKKVLPTPEYAVAIDAAWLYNAARRIDAITDGVTLLGMAIGHGLLAVCAAEPLGAEASESCAVDFEAPKTEMRLNAKYVWQALSDIAGTVQLRFTDAVHAVEIVAGDHYRAVIMPVRPPKRGGR